MKIPVKFKKTCARILMLFGIVVYTMFTIVQLTRETTQKYFVQEAMPIEYSDGRVRVNNNSAGVKITTSTTNTPTHPPPTTTIKPPTPTGCKTPFKKAYDQERNFLCYINYARFGNEMFTYASSYGIASITNMTLVVNSQTPLLQYFAISAKVVDDFACVVKGSKVRIAKRACVFDKTMFNIPKRDNCCVDYYLQSYKYFDLVKADIKKQFQFKAEIREKSMKVIKSAIEDYHKRTPQNTNSTRPVVVGVHIRRGDMVNNPFGYAVATPHYMKNAASFFKSKFNNAVFLVCSDGMAWAKKHVTGNDVIYIEGNTPEVDMSVLVSCDHLVTTVGSFSWWAGYLNPGIKVYYQWPARKNSPLRKEFSSDYSDFFPSDWVGMK